MPTYIINTLSKNPQHARNRFERNQRTGMRTKKKVTKVKYIGKKDGLYRWEVTYKMRGPTTRRKGMFDL